MSLVSQVSSLALRISTEIKAVYTLTGALSGLTTANKTSLVAAINELKAATASASGISDGTTASATTWSSAKINTAINAATAALVASSPAALDTLNELAASLGNDANFATTTATALGNRLDLSTAKTYTAAQKTQGQANLDVPSNALIGDTTTDFVAVFNAGLL